MNQKLYYLQVISTLSVVFPLISGVRGWKAREWPLRLFVLFLMIGFFIDLVGWYSYLNKGASLNLKVRYGYILLEAIFLFWYVSRFFPAKNLRSSFAHAWLVLVPFWVGSIYFDIGMSVFETTSEVLIAFASSFCMLSMIEKQEHVEHSTEFILLLGVFFFCFCTFFFTSLLASQLGLKVWYVHNIINVMTNLIYGWALLKQATALQGR